MKKPRRIFEIYFSGAQDAGKRIWITTGLPVGDGLVVEDCLRAKNLPNDEYALTPDDSGYLKMEGYVYV